MEDGPGSPCLKRPGGEAQVELLLPRRPGEELAKGTPLDVEGGRLSDGPAPFGPVPRDLLPDDSGVGERELRPGADALLRGLGSPLLAGRLQRHAPASDAQAE